MDHHNVFEDEDLLTSPQVKTVNNAINVYTLQSSL